jgi:mannosyltransferase OCH1-like enzyme
MAEPRVTRQIGVNSSPAPAYVHQVWVGGQFPARPAQLASIASWKRAFPRAEHVLWTDATADAFVRDEYPRVWPAYAALETPVQKADLLRYMALHARGGLYADLDYVCLRPFAVDPDATAFGEAHVAGTPNNALIVAPAGCPVMAALLAEAQRRLAAPARTLEPRLARVFRETGPGLVGDVVRAAGARRVVRLPAARFNPCDVCGRCRPGGFAVHASAHEWASGWESALKRAWCVVSGIWSGLWKD